MLWHTRLLSVWIAVILPEGSLKSGTSFVGYSDLQGASRKDAIHNTRVYSDLEL